MLLLFVCCCYCAAATRRERFTQHPYPVIIFNAEEQEHVKFIKSTSFDETFTSTHRTRQSSSFFLLLYFRHFFVITQHRNYLRIKKKREIRREKKFFISLTSRSSLFWRKTNNRKIQPKNQIYPTASSMGILQGDSPTPGPAMYWVSYLPFSFN